MKNSGEKSNCFTEMAGTWEEMHKKDYKWFIRQESEETSNAHQGFSLGIQMKPKVGTL